VKHKLIVTTLALVCLYLAGCAFTEPTWRDVPQPTRFKTSDQQKLQAAHHWQLIADDFAQKLAATLSSQLGGRALYVPQPGGEQAFVGGFRDLLITSLVNMGLPVAANESDPGALVADVRYNIYRFNPDRAKDTYYYGDATMLAAGLWVFGDAVVHREGLSSLSTRDAFSASAKLVTGTALLAETLAYLSNEDIPGGPKKGRFASGPVPQSEILLTVSVADHGRFVSRYSSIYYTADEDEALYWDRQKGGAGSRLSVKGDCEERQLCAR
jgi:hypothetical protein